MKRIDGMKFLAFGLLLSMFTLGSALSLADDSSSGCGMGWMVTKRNSLLSSLARTFTNATFSSTIGMTSGTSGCSQHSIVKNDRKGLHFTEANYHQLMVEMSAGQGEFLENYAQVLGCSPESYPSFARTLKQNYGSIFTTPQVTPREVLNNVIDQLKKNGPQKVHCSTFII